MKNSVKSFIASGLAGIISLTSTVSAFAAGSVHKTYKMSENQNVVVGWLHGDGFVTTNVADYSYAGYHGFPQSGLPNSADVTADNFVSLDVLDKESAAGTITSQIAYCVTPEKHITSSQYNVSLKEAKDSSAGLSEEQIKLLTKAMMVGYTGQSDLINRKSGFSGLEGLMTDVPAPYRYKKADGSYYSYTSHRIATQVLVWNIKQGWYDNKYEQIAVNLFLKELPAKYKSECFDVYNKLKSAMSGSNANEAYDLLNKLKDWTAKFNDEDEKNDPFSVIVAADESATYTITLPQNANKVFNNIVAETETAVKAIDKDASVNLSGNRLIVKTSKKLDSKAVTVAPSIYTAAFSGVSFVDIAIGEAGGVIQDIIVPNVPEFKFSFGGGDTIPDTETSLNKTWDGASHKDIGFTDYDLYSFILGDNVFPQQDLDGNVTLMPTLGTTKYYIFEEDTPGVPGKYTYKGDTTDVNKATRLVVDDNDNIEIKNLPAKSDDRRNQFLTEIIPTGGRFNGLDGKYLMLETLKDEETGAFAINNTSTGIGLLVFDKSFVLPSGAEITAETTGKAAELRANAIAGLTFTIYDASYTIVPTTGSNGVYECSDPDYVAKGTKGSADALKLDADGRIVISNLPSGIYTIVENADTAKTLKIVTTGATLAKTAQVSRGVDTVEKALNTAANAKLTNILDYTPTTVQVMKDSEDGTKAGFEFTLSCSDASVVIEEPTKKTNDSGIVSWDELPSKDSNGNLLKYTVTEIRPTNKKYLATKPQTLNAIPGGIVKFDFFNYLTTAILAINKTSEDGYVKGIEFTVEAISSTGTVLETYTMYTDSTGYAQLEDLPMYDDTGANITYVVTETEMLRYNKVAPREVQFTDEEDRFALLEIHNTPKKSAYAFVKMVDDPLTTATSFNEFSFTLTGTDGSSQTQHPDENGLVVFEDLYLYDINNKPIVYTVSEDYVKGITEKYYTPAPIKDITLTPMTDEEIERYKENILAGHIKNMMINTTKPGKLVITKFNEKHEPLGEAGFILFTKNDYDNAVASGRTPAEIATGKVIDPKGFAMSNASGIAEFNDLKVGVPYVVIEYRAPDGYTEATDEPLVFYVESADFEAASNLYIHHEAFINYPAKSIKLLKKDSVTGNPLAGAVFELRDPDGNVVRTFMTDKNGEATYDNIKNKKYTLVETSAPVGYKLAENEADRTWEVDYSSTDNAVIEIEITNAPEITSPTIAIYKVDGEDSKPLTGAVFTLYKGSVSEENKISDQQTDFAGKATWENLEVGTYIAKETIAPAGYKLIDKEFTFNVDSTEAKLYYEYVENISDSKAKLAIVKLNSATKEPLADVGFTLYTSDGKKIETKSTDAEGKLSFTRLKYDTSYEVLESTAPDGFTVVEGSLKFSIDNTGKVVYDQKPDVVTEATEDGNVTWINTPKTEYGDLKIVKTSYDNVVKGMTFMITGNGETFQSTTDEEGAIIFTHLPVYGTDGKLIEYAISEINTPDRYLAFATVNTTLKVNEMTTVNVENHEKPASAGIKVIKHSEDGNIEGITFTITSSNNKTYTLTTDASGIAILKGLPLKNGDEYIEYTVTENPVPGYVELLPQTVLLEVEDSVVDLEFTNTKVESSVKLYKVDSSNTPLEGATFSLYKDAAGTQFVASQKTKLVGGKALVSFEEGLSTSTTYYLRETAVPTGSEYVLSKTVWECQIDDKGETTYREYGSEAEFSKEIPTCVNTTETGSPVKLIKTDGTNSLEGAKFGLFTDEKCKVKIDEKTTKIDSDTTSDTYNMAIVSFIAEKGNTYYIKETAAPSGYQAVNTVYVAKVSDKGEVTYSVKGSTSFSSTFPVCVNKKKSETTPTTTTTTTTTTTVTSVTTPITSVVTFGTTTGNTTTSNSTTSSVTTVTSAGTTTDVTTATSYGTTTVGTTGTDDTTSRPKYSTTPSDTTVPPEYTTTTDIDTTVPPDVTTPYIPDQPDIPDTPETPDVPENENPNTGVNMDVVGFSVLALFGAAICATSLAKGISARKKEKAAKN